jgi:ATP-binding cassette subfamily C protein CydD
MATTDSSIPSKAPSQPDADQAPAVFLRQIKADAAPELKKVALASIVGVVGLLGFSVAVAELVSLAINHQAPAYWLWLLAVIAIALRFGAHLYRDRLGQRISARIRLRIRRQLLTHANQSGPFSLQAQGNTAWWAQRHIEQVDALHGYLAKYLPARMTAAFVPLIIIAVCMSIDWVAGLLLLLATPLIPFFMALIGWGAESVQKTQQDQQAALASQLLDRLEALPWLRRQGALQSSSESVDQAAETYRSLSMRVLRVVFLSSATLELVSAMSIGLLAIYIGFSLVGFLTFGPASALTLFSGLFLLMLAPECFLPLRQLAQAHHDMTAAKAAAQTLAPILLEQTVLEEPVLEKSLHGKQVTHDAKLFSGVTLDQVSFHYDGQTEAALLNDVSIVFEPGQVIGIAGNSGSGKSTLLGLMAGFLSPTKGRVLRTEHWSWLNQQPYLFHSTLRENLLLACQTIPPDSQLIQALGDAGITLPDATLTNGLDTPIGDLNRGVSGGQAQRIALARALLNQSTLWLLDEPTAALDEQTRDQLLDTLLNRAKRDQVTVIVASHDQALLARCDKVYSIQAGKLLPFSPEGVAS